MHGPISTRVPRRTLHLILQKLWEVRYVAIHREVGQIAGIPPQFLQHLKTSKGHFPVVNGRVDEELWIRATAGVLQEVWE